MAEGKPKQTAEILEKIGLTQQESNVYLTLLRLQEAQTGLLCTESKIASSNIYKILESLMKKGLVSYRLQNNIKIFSPSPVETLNDLFVEKKKEIENERVAIAELISSLKKQKPEKEAYSSYKYFEGLVGVKAMWNEINEYMNSKMILKLYTGKRESYEGLIGFYSEHHKLRVKKKIKEQMIFPFEDRELGKKREKQYQYTEIKFLDLNNEAEWGVVGDIFYIQYITAKKPRAFLIKDKFFALTFEQVFNQLWSSAKR
jgi:sugar-specific transcriptional regulator TrmB